jgi:hypothetical protein
MLNLLWGVIWEKININGLGIMKSLGLCVCEIHLVEVTLKSSV